MKNRVLTFIIGIFVGAIIATSGFLIYAKTAMPDNMRPMMNQGNGMRPPEIPNGQNGGRPGMPSAQM